MKKIIQYIVKILKHASKDENMTGMISTMGGGYNPNDIFKNEEALKNKVNDNEVHEVEIDGKKTIITVKYPDKKDNIFFVNKKTECE